MRGRKKSRVPRELKQAAERWKQWRRARALGTRIPEPLWQMAVRLAGQYGVCRTAATLSLDYYSLKQRVDDSALPAVLPDSSQRPAFVELPASPLAAVGECVIEFENAVGSRMRIHLRGSQLPDLIALGRSFWHADP